MADLVCRFRKAAGLSQQELANCAGLSVAAISAIERGARRRPQPHTVRVLASALALSAEDRMLLITTAARSEAAAPSSPPLPYASEKPRSMRSSSWRYIRAALVPSALVVTLAASVILRSPYLDAIVLVSSLVPALLAEALFWRLRSSEAASEPDASDQVADRLADHLRWQWERAAVDRGLVYPAPVSVRWRWAAHAVTGSTAEAVAGPDRGAGRFPPLPGFAPSTESHLKEGTVADLLRVYAGLGSGRLVLIGGPGAGKSAAAIRLVLDALAHRRGLGDQRACAPVPVLLAVHGWDPRQESIEDWVARRLSADYRALIGRGRGRHTAARLISTGRLALVLDGLDEMHETLMPVAVRALSEQARFRIVVLARSLDMVAATTQVHLRGAAALELLSVTARDAAGYLENCQVQPLPPGWRRLVDHIRAHPRSAVAVAMRTPLMLSLVRDVYHAEDPVDDLLDPDTFPSPSAVEDHLLDQVVPTAYELRPGRPTGRWNSSQAARWLRQLALRMRAQNSPTVAWWTIPAWTPAWPRVLVTGAVVGIPVGFAGAFIPRSGEGVIARIGTGLLLGHHAVPMAIAFAVLGALMAWLQEHRTPRHLGRLSIPSLLRRYMPVPGLSAGFVVGLGSSLVLGVEAGLVVGVGVALVYGLSRGLSGQIEVDDIAIEPRALWQRDRAFGVLAGLVVSLAFGLAGWITFGVQGGLLLGTADGLAVVLVSPQAWRLFLGSIQLRLSGRGPILMLDFLEDARARHVLRTVGPVYQFRHARLQERLAGSPTPSPDMRR